VVDQYGLVRILTPEEVELTKAFNPRVYSIPGPLGLSTSGKRLAFRRYRSLRSREAEVQPEIMAPKIKVVL
jgi:hypothetical protein